MVGSNLVTKKALLTAGFTPGRAGKKICRITPHHAVGNLTVERIGQVLESSKISATYGIQDENIAQYVSEENRPWTSSSAANDNEAITIEIANNCSVADGDKLGWPISDKSLDTFIKLAVDIMIRYDFPPLVVGENLTWHSMFSATVCPGPYLMSKMQHIADTCNSIVFPVPAPSKTLYGVVKQVVALSSKEQAEKYASQLNAQSSDLNKEFYKVIEIVRD